VFAGNQLKRRLIIVVKSCLDEIVRLKEILLKYRLANNENIIGYEITEILNYERRLNISFPIAYINYLQTMGKLRGYIFETDAVRLEDLERNRKRLSHLDFYDKICVFNYDYGSYSLFFYCDGVDNPLIYDYSEFHGIRFTGNDFIGYLSKCIESLNSLENIERF
jgi:hypothetical protein